MTRERCGQVGTILSMLALAGLFGSFLIPLPAHPAPGHEHDTLSLIQDWSRILVFCGSGALLLLAVVFWIIGRQPRRVPGP